MMVQRGFGWQYTFQHYTMQGSGGGVQKNFRLFLKGKIKEAQVFKNTSFPFSATK